MQIDTIRRRTNGTIDIDSYRRDAVALRTEARVQVGRRALRYGWPVVSAAALLAVVMLSSHGRTAPAAGSIGSCNRQALYAKVETLRRGLHC